MNMDAIPILNDAVGGVTVEVTEDFSAVDPSIGMGQVTLRGDQALNYVRTRKDVGDQLNLSRIQRQKQYLEAFAEAFRIRSKADGGRFERGQGLISTNSNHITVSFKASPLEKQLITTDRMELNQILREKMAQNTHNVVL